MVGRMEHEAPEYCSFSPHHPCYPLSFGQLDPSHPIGHQARGVLKQLHRVVILLCSREIDIFFS